MYIILNYRGTKEYAEKSEVRGKRVSSPETIITSPFTKTKTRLLSMETVAQSHSALGSVFLGSRGDL